MMDFEDSHRLVPFDQLISPTNNGSAPPEKMGRRATMSVFESPSLFRSPAGLDLLSLSARKRKRKKVDEDSLSIQSLDIQTSDTNNSSAGKRLRKSLSRVVSLVNMTSPVKPVKKLGGSLQRSLSFKNILSHSQSSSNTKQPATAPYKKPQATPTKRRPSKLWQETIDGDVTNIFSEMQIRRQNAIFELYQCEEDLVVDLCMVKSLYCDSMKKLGLMSDAELEQVFGMIETLTPLHQDLASRLQAQRQPDGSTDKVGHILLDWISGLLSYVPYCANQIFVRELLEQKKNDKHVQDFLQRCQESPFSRKLDLWTFLDIPRSRLVKYPLLFKNIQSRTPENHEDIALLEEAIATVEEIINEVDQKTGESKCRFYKERFEYIEEAQHHSTVDNSKSLLLDGILRNNRGTKLTAYLFDRALILTRPTTRHERTCYQIYRYPLALSELVVENLEDGSVKMGSFRNMLGQGQGSKYVFRVTWPNQMGKGYTHTLQARDEHDKKQWLNSLNEAIEKAKVLKSQDGIDPVIVPSDQRKASSDEDEDHLDDSMEKENMICLDDVVMASPEMSSPALRKRSVARSTLNMMSPNFSTPPLKSKRRSMSRSQSSCILTTPNLQGMELQFADDSSPEDDETPSAKRRRSHVMPNATPGAQPGVKTPSTKKLTPSSDTTPITKRTPKSSVKTPTDPNALDTPTLPRSEISSPPKTAPPTKDADKRSTSKLRRASATNSLNNVTSPPVRTTRTSARNLKRLSCQ